MIFSRRVQQQKTEEPISVTEEGIVIVFSDSHCKKAPFPITDKTVGTSKITSESFEHFLNAFSPIDVTKWGIIICSRDEHSQNVKSAIFVTNEGIVIFSINEQPSNEWSPIVFTDDGIKIWLRDEQSLNAKFPIEVNDAGVSNKTSVSNEHPLNA